MPINPEILGSTVNIAGQQSAEDALAAKEAEAVEQKQSLGTPLITPGEMQDMWASEASGAASMTAFDYGPKLSFSAAGTPFTGSRYEGQAFIPPSSQAALPPPPVEDRWAAVGINGRVDSGFDPWQGPLPGSQSQAVALPPARFGSYEEANTLKADILNDARNSWTASGRYSSVGGKAFNAEVQEAYVSQGLAEFPEEDSPSFGSRMRTGLKGQGGYALAYGLQSVAEGASRAYAGDNDGESHTDAQRDANATGMLPGLFTVGGAVIGAGLGNPILGAGIAGGIGNIAQGVLGSGFGIQDSQERAASGLAVGRGGAEAAEEFSKVLTSVVTPAAKELAEAFQKLGQSGPVSASAAAGLAPFQAQFGTAFSQTVSTEDRFLSGSPFLAGVRERFGTGKGAIDVPQADYLGAAGAAAATGDYDAMIASVGFAQAKGDRDGENPAYRRDSEFVDRYKRNAGFGQDVKDFFTGDGGQQAAYVAAQERLGNTGAGGAHVAGTGETQFMPGYTPQADLAATFQKQYETFQADQASVSKASASLGADAGRLKLSEMTGGGAAALLAAQGGLEADARGGIDALETDISTLTGYRKKYPGQSRYYDDLIATDREKEAQFQAVPTQNRVEAFRTGLGERSAAFSLSVTRAQIEGKSAEDIYARTQSESRYLQGVESDPRNPLSPTERAGIEQGRLQSVYQAQQGVFSERLENDDNRIGASQAAVTKAEAFSNPQGIQSALAGEAGAVAEKIRELSQEMRTAGQTAADLRREQGELNQANTQAVQIAARQRDQAVQSAYAQDSDQRAIDTAGLGHAVRNGGSSAVDWDTLNRDWGKTFGDDRDAIGKYAPGSDDWQKARAKYVGDAASSRDQADALVQYSPDARTRAADTLGDLGLSRAEHGFNRAKLAPYTDAGADPFARGGELEEAISRGQARLGSDWRKEAAHRQSLLGRVGPDGKPLWDDAAQAGYDQDFARYQERSEGLQDRRAVLEHERLEAAYGAIPEMIAGGPGRGVGAALITPRAISALYTPNAQNGSWAGVPPGGHAVAGMAPLSPYGKASDAHPDLIALSAPGASGMGETNRLLSVLVSEVQKQGRGTSRQGGPQAPYNPAGPAGRALGFVYNPNSGH